LGVVSSVALFCHENLPFSRPYRDSQYTLTFPRWARLFVSCFLFTRLPRAKCSRKLISGVRGSRKLIEAPVLQEYATGASE
jgi:hypothetical protein